MSIKFKYILIVISLIILICSVGCERKGVVEPLPTGPATTAQILTVTANPNTLFAGSTREISIITATLKYFDDTPIVNKKLILKICNENGMKINVGYFPNKKRVVTRLTNEKGKVQIKYYGPLSTEVALYTKVYIWVFVEEKGEEFLQEKAPILIVPKRF